MPCSDDTRVAASTSPMLALGRWALTMAAACGAGDEPETSVGLAELHSSSVLVGEDELAYSVAWSPISDHALAGTTTELRLLAIEDEGHHLRVADRYVGGYRHMSIDWTADGTRALTAGSDGRVHLFEVDGASESLTHGVALAVDAVGLFAVALSPDEQHALACGEDGSLSLLRVDLARAELAVVDRFPAHRRCVVARWSPAGTHAVSLGPKESTFLYRVDLEAPKLEAVALVRSGEEPGAVSFGRSETEVVLGTFGSRHRVTYLSFEPEAGRLRQQQAFDDFAGGLKVIEPAHDGDAFIIAEHDGAPRLYLRTEAPSLERVYSHDDDGSGSHDISWSPDDRFIIRAASQLDQFEVLEVRRPSPG